MADVTSITSTTGLIFDTNSIDVSQYYLNFTGIAGDTTVTISGLTGLDFNSIATQIMDIKQHQLIDPLVEKIKDTTFRLQAYSYFEEKLKNLMSVADELRFVSNLNALGIFADNENIISGTASSGAVETTYYINVNSLASPNYIMANKVEDSNAIKDLYKDKVVLDTNGELSITIKELKPDGTPIDSTAKTISIDISSVKSLYDLINEINNAASDYLKATYFFDGKEYRLSITGKEGYDISISDTATVFSTNSYQDINSNPGDLSLTGLVYNKTSGSWENINNLHLNFINNSTNTFEDSNGNIYETPNVNLDIKSIGSTSFKIAPNTEIIENKLENFVNTYNEVLKTYYDLTYFNNQNDKGILFGDQFLLQIKNKLQEILSTPVGNYTLAQIGLELTDPINAPADAYKDSNGHVIPGSLYFDKDKFEEIMSKNPDAVVTLLAGTPDGKIKGVMDNLYDYIFNLTLPAGPFYWEAMISKKKIQYFQNQIYNYQQMLWQEFTSLVLRFSLTEGYIAQLQAMSQSLSAAQSGMNTNPLLF